MQKLFLTLILVLFLFTFDTFAQNSSIAEAYKQDVKIRKTGMAILGTWAVGNMITGAIGRSQSSGQTAYFHEMNLIWNVVNLGIAGAGYYFTATGEMPENASALLNDQVSFQKTLLFNAGLDLAYIAGGFYLMERAKSTTNRPERLKGYGKSVILQGSFLFVFDIILHTIHSKQSSQISDFLTHVQLGPNQVGFLIGL
ncbi:hypothetical protein MATR_11810 [Marivirga tractuosa]|uniref:Uncharacterized protein n=1 Tax=Marivirga tractuosa (strain ATCC 23168 / DSM 4126 / NBRC 15989 / NCIMB 1408 / VKM B-1430 / H-43) TaxID=643867 RepID=E4TKM5_MARTH|nr:hypothetical protein [Marivirga tractuosa]ADR21191.1 hypothetical protein Ftrac_1196 [Marivirga tractuosa DSM 4126]BDD14356.1 hypothetical protein MATR_11810 [Marivirga tractuosa]